MITCFGSLNADMIFQMDSAPQAGQTLIARNFRVEAGGKGGNQAVAGARAGSRVVMVGAVGDDGFASIVHKELISSGCDVTHIAKADKATGTAAIIVDGHGANRIAVAKGANLYARSAQIDHRLLAETKILLLQMENDPHEVEDLLLRAKSANILSILNLAPAAKISRESLAQCGILIVNEDEALFAANWLGCAATARALANTLGICVVRTLGEKGSEAALGDRNIHVAAHPIKAADTTSAGDCFVGVLAASLDANHDLEDAMRRATAAAAICCSRYGSQSSLPWLYEFDPNEPAPTVAPAVV